MNYAIVKWNPGFTQSLFAQAKAQGIVETSFTTVRKSNDGTLAVLKWESGPLPQALQANLIAQYDHPGILGQMNTTAWASPKFGVSLQSPIVPVMAIFESPMTAVAPSFWQKHGWKVAGAIAGAAAAGAALWHYLG